MPSHPARDTLNMLAESLYDKFSEISAWASNEQEIREEIHGHIQQALKDLYGMDFKASRAEKNTSLKGAPSRRLDRSYGGVIVEWEKDISTPRHKEHAANQALEYLENERRNASTRDDYFTAVVSDGSQWGFLIVDSTDDEHQDTLFAPQVDLPAIQRFRWVENSPSACRQFLELVGSHQKTPITDKSLTALFGPGSTIAKRNIAALAKAAGTRVDGDRTTTLYQEWRRALDIIYGNLDSRESDLADIVKAAYQFPTASLLGEQLFVLHTYFALVGRLIATELLAVSANCPEEAPSTWGALDDDAFIAKLQSLENGQLPGDIQVINLFEADLFSWWAEGAADNNSLRTELRELVSGLNKLAFPRTAFGPGKAGDVLRELYQSLIPRQLRKSLGEFLTPHWLAQASLQDLVEAGAPIKSGRVLDPTCGTGTFLLPIISQRLRELKTQETITAEDIQAVLDSVAGIDLNPVAVTACRVNIVLALGDLSLNGPLSLPIWRADSIIVPELTKNQTAISGNEALPQHNLLNTSLDEPFTIPLSVKNSHKVAELRDIIESCISDVKLLEEDVEESNQSVNSALERFVEEYEYHFSESDMPIDLDYSFEDDITVAKNLFKQIAVLAQQGRNGVWARLIENAYAPVFAGKFDVVVGNPPWISWKNLPASWRNQTEDIWRRCGMWEVARQPGENYSTPNGDIATLVYAISVSRYAKPGGYVGLLVPRALAIADPGSKLFRQFHLAPSPRDMELYPTSFDVAFNPVSISDWSAIDPFKPDASTTPIFLISKTAEAASFPIEGKKWSRNTKSVIKADKSNWKSYRPSLVETAGKFMPVSQTDPTSALSFHNASTAALINSGTNAYTFGKGLDTRGANGVLFVEVRRHKTDLSLVRVENEPSRGRNNLVQKQSSFIENDLVYPLALGRDLGAWHVSPSAHVVIPHDPEEITHAFTRRELSRKYKKTYKWLSSNDEVMGNRNPPSKAWDLSLEGKDRYRVQGVSKHMMQEFLVGVREIAERPSAALIEATYNEELGRVIKPLVDHKLNFCAVGSREEGLYLVAMHNSTPMQDLLVSFISSTSVSPKSLNRLPIPLYDSSNQHMSDLVALSDAINPNGHLSRDEVQENLASLQREMDEIVLKIIDEFEGYEPQPTAEKRSKKIDRRKPNTEDFNAPLF
ncbi:N-6 DNA methylase (plasmid) [Rothia amarae]|uniref:site-specific DNA-methyltransferase (adenine-specific) n=1 Tax=Rothia amarae TaxID=169480 RepID=A0A7S6WWK5_9MICC|nr:N-6 DNA methylase [Rothia amarae]QOW64933.1 N-6 DNA methylase [Rothia amarae]